MSKYAGFGSVELQKPKRSYFDLSHEKRLSTRAGRLTPVLITEALPGDTFNGSTEVLVRVAPLLAPIYDRLELYVHFFFVPNRLLWDEWETFITTGRLGQDVGEAAPVPPYMQANDLVSSGELVVGKSSLLDYLGVPLLAEFGDEAAWAAAGTTLDMMPVAAYQKIFSDYYRDRNFVADDVMDDDFPLMSGNMTTNHASILGEFLTVKRRSYKHDYFTSALPFVQRGNEVLMPLAGTGSVTYLDETIVQGGSLTDDDEPLSFQWNAGISAGNVGIGQGLSPDLGRIENIDEVLLTASSVTINDFRTAYALQLWYERSAVGGSRYTENTQVMFGVKPQDARLQRAEYIGGGRMPIKISEIVSTAYSDDGEATVPLANLAGHGITYGNTNRFRYYCVEHGFIVGIASIMNSPSYHQGMPRMFYKRRSFTEYVWPLFAKLGEQQVDLAELYASPANLTPDENGEYPLFGYQSRYADWKHILNTNHGEFHDTLLFWTLTRSWNSSPTLGEAFVLYDDASQNRIFAVGGDEDNFWLYVHNAIGVKRCLPYFGTPNQMGFMY